MTDIATFIAGVLLGALASWFITHRYYLKASAEQRTELERLREELRPKNTLADFERLLVTANWTKQQINRSEVWICDADSTFQIQQGERSREFSERWTEVYPDKNSSLYPVYLSIAGVVVKELDFISIDGGRIFVPMAEVRPVGEGQVDYFWNLHSLEMKVCRIVGSYYVYRDIFGVARMSSLAIVE